MSTSRTEILEWVERGRLPAEALPAVLRLARITPGPAEWRRFLSRLTLWLGTVFCAAAVIFFFAYNWQAMGRYAKFGLAEGLIIAAVFLAWRLGLERAGGKAALLAAALLVGALLALVGQTYQTGADTYELFAVWALAILPWVAVSCFGALWLLWIGLINLAALGSARFPACKYRASDRIPDLDGGGLPGLPALATRPVRVGRGGSQHNHSRDHFAVQPVAKTE